MKKKLIIPMLLMSFSAISFADGENYSDYKAFLIGDEYGNVVKQDNETTVRPLASVTKIMTSLLTLEKIRYGETSLDTIVTVSSRSSKIPYGIQLKAGAQYTVRDLLKATIVKSSNSAANTLAEHIGGSTENFVAQMNKKARDLGLRSLRYCSPHGLPPHYGVPCMDQGNAQDLYALAQYVVKEYPEYLNYSKNSSATIGSGTTLKSTNTLLGKVQGLDGLKTGYHDAAGSNIVLTAERRNDRVIAVILGSNKAKNRNAIGQREIENYYANGGNAQTGGNRSADAKKKQETRNQIVVPEQLQNRQNQSTIGVEILR